MRRARRACEDAGALTDWEKMEEDGGAVEQLELHINDVVQALEAELRPTATRERVVAELEVEWYIK